MQTEVNGEHDGRSPPSAEIQRSELVAEVNRLRQELESTRDERDVYLKALKTVLPCEPFSFEQAELRELEEKGYTLEQILQEMKSEGITDNG